MGKTMAVIPGSRHTVSRVLWDLSQLLTNFSFWFFLAWLEIRQQYRRSSLGPFWITLTTAGYVLALIVVFGVLFNIRSQDYAPWVTLGVISWSFITASLGEAGIVLIGKKQLLTHRQISHNGLVFAALLKWAITFLHQLPIYAGVMVFYNIPLTLNTAWVLLTIPALTVILHPMCLVIAYLSMRLRDVPPLVNAILTPLFFVTPVMWVPDQLGDKAWIADWNPFGAMIGLIREPLLGHAIPNSMFLTAFATGIVLWSISILMQIAFRRRIMYWA